jgi:SIT4-associating protein SAP185/190
MSLRPPANLPTHHHQVNSIKLDNEPQGGQETSGTDNKQPEPEASRPEDVPPPLFSSNEKPAESAEAPATETTQEPNTANDGGDEDSAEQYIQIDTDGQPVVGDYLKIMFVENKVVPTILVSISCSLETMYSTN